MRKQYIHIVNMALAKIASSGDWDGIYAIGECAKISTNGTLPIIKSNGTNHHISTSGYYSRIISHGHDVSVSASDRAEIYSDGKMQHYTQVALTVKLRQSEITQIYVLALPTDMSIHVARVQGLCHLKTNRL